VDPLGRVRDLEGPPRGDDGGARGSARAGVRVGPEGLHLHGAGLVLDVVGADGGDRLTSARRARHIARPRARWEREPPRGSLVLARSFNDNRWDRWVQTAGCAWGKLSPPSGGERAEPRTTEGPGRGSGRSRGSAPTGKGSTRHAHRDPRSRLAATRASATGARRRFEGDGDNACKGRTWGTRVTARGRPCVEAPVWGGVVCVVVLRRQPSGGAVPGLRDVARLLRTRLRARRLGRPYPVSRDRRESASKTRPAV